MSQNETIRRLYGALVRPLKADEALLEAAFGLGRYRGCRGMMTSGRPNWEGRLRSLAVCETRRRGSHVR